MHSYLASILKQHVTSGPILHYTNIEHLSQSINLDWIGLIQSQIIWILNCLLFPSTMTLGKFPNLSVCQLPYL